MLLDPTTWELTQRADEVLSFAGPDLTGRCAAETHEAALELRTAPHATVRDAIAELRELRALLLRELAPMGMAAAACGTHPAAMAEPTKVSPSSRYQVIYQTTRDLARREPTFALHVHVGVPDAQSAIRLVNALRAHLPLLLALSASSPMLRGRATGLASNRTILFQGFPRTGIPRRFDSYRDWTATVDLLVRSGAIPEPTFLWWDVRPQPRLGTVEVRIMDAQPQLASTAGLTALVQALARLELEQGYASQKLIGAQEVLAENRFIAARDATDGRVHRPGAGRAGPAAARTRRSSRGRTPARRCARLGAGARPAADGGSGARATPAGAARGVGRRARARRRPRGALRGLRLRPKTLPSARQPPAWSARACAPAGRARRSAT